MNLAPLAPVVRTSLADLVHERLLESILSGILGCGAHLNVADIARSKEFYGKAFGWSFTDYGPAYCR